MKHLTRVRSVLAFAAAGLLGTACGPHGNVEGVVFENNSASLAMGPPGVLISARNVVKENLFLRVAIGDNVSEIRADENGDYLLDTRFPSNSQTEVAVQWFETVGVDVALLATASKRIDVGSATSPVIVRFLSDQYNTNHDEDGDGFTNLEERQEGFLFNDNTSGPAIAPVLVPLSVMLSLPDILVQAPGDVRAQLDISATVNGTELALTRNGDQWTGKTEVVENSEPLVRADVFATTERRLLVANRSSSRNVESGGEVIFGPGDYQELDSLNEDGDEFNNAEELAQGSDHANELDPDFDGDELSFGDDNCPQVSNTDQADADNDGIGDVCDDTPNGPIVIEPPEEDTPEEDTPEEDTPEEDTPEEDTPEEDTPEEDTPEEDTPEEDTPEEDTPEEDTPEEDTP